MIRLVDVSAAFGDETVLEHVDLHIPAGTHAALMGPSGCGKSTLLRLIAGLISPSRGEISVHAERTSYVFQEPRLLPTRSALQNVNVVLGDKKGTLPHAEAWLNLTGLGDALDKRPAELSGGMRQRVNIARALAYGGDLFLLDEPFQGIDEKRKSGLIDLLTEKTRGKTLLLATHDITEAEALCDRIYHYNGNTFLPA